MRRVRGSNFILMIGVLGLSACAEGALEFGGSGQTDETTSATGTVTREGAQDVERPDIFTTSEPALWDGRPSLGGIWIAHPDVTDPERAILVNEATGQRVAGALFRRERDNPGPRLQLSSDAAAALNILAGQPTEVTVIAVRREEIEVPAEEPEAETDAEADADGTEIAEGESTEDAVPPEGTAEETPRRRNFFERIFGVRRSANADEIAASAEAAAAGAETAASADVPSIETQTLDPVATTTAAAAAAISRAEASDKPVARPVRTEEPAVAAAPTIDQSAEETETPPEPEAPAAPELRNPFIQVGVYSVQENADAAAAELRQAGIVPTVLQGERDDGSSFWRVVVGPVTTADDQATLLGQVRGAGYNDAFLAPN